MLVLILNEEGALKTAASLRANAARHPAQGRAAGIEPVPGLPGAASG